MIIFGIYGTKDGRVRFGKMIWWFGIVWCHEFEGLNGWFDREFMFWLMMEIRTHAVERYLYDIDSHRQKPHRHIDISINQSHRISDHIWTDLFLTCTAFGPSQCQRRQLVEPIPITVFNSVLYWTQWNNYYCTVLIVLLLFLLEFKSTPAHLLLSTAEWVSDLAVGDFRPTSSSQIEHHLLDSIRWVQTHIQDGGGSVPCLSSAVWGWSTGLPSAAERGPGMNIYTDWNNNKSNLKKYNLAWSIDSLTWRIIPNHHNLKSAACYCYFFNVSQLILL